MAMPSVKRTGTLGYALRPYVVINDAPEEGIAQNHSPMTERRSHSSHQAAQPNATICKRLEVDKPELKGQPHAT
jgi:hypothetical protein